MRRITALAASSALVVIGCRDVTAPDVAPAHARRSFLLSPGGHILVAPGTMQGWAFYDDGADTVCTNQVLCSMVDGPAGVQAGSGSAELATPAATNGIALVLVDYAGLRLDRITDLRYSTYRQSHDAGQNLAIALQFNADYDLTDGLTGYQGRLVFEPYQGSGGNVPDTLWQSWDAKAGKWWGTRASVSRGDVAVANPCVQATPCTWSELLATFPNVGVHATYGAIYLKAGSSWPGFRGNADNLTIGVDGATTTFDFERTGAAVPPLPPAGVPDWVYADSNFVSGGTTIAGNLAKHVVMVAFASGTPVSTRNAAVALVNGVVVGGIPIDDDGEGVYYVQVTTAETPESVLSAVHAIAAAPGVAMAIPIINDAITPNYRKPIDGDSARVWQVDTARADGGNWALESIAAPMAWGCSTGDSTVRVAVIDQGFHKIDDLTATRHDPFSPLTDSVRHGTAVASILAAGGNNGFGSTGVMWRSDLRLWNDQLSISESTGLPDSVMKNLAEDGLLQHVLRMRKAVLDSARVINVSAGLQIWSGIPRRLHTIADDSAGHRYIEERVRPAMRYVLSLRDGQSNAPLFVFSSGNGDDVGNGRDAILNGYPVAAKDYPGRVLVVAATHADVAHDQIQSFVNLGPQVQIAAPGDRVMALDQYGQIAPIGQTSAAAPLVAGVAGLLISFDPALTVNEVRDFIVAGALQGGRTATQSHNPQILPYLDAYQSLKLAAQRKGAPLCGNRVYKSGNAIIALRGTTPDTIIALSPNRADSNYAEIDVFHGGRRIDLGSRHAFEWNPTTRAFVERTPYVFPQTIPRGGVYLSSRGLEHEGRLHASTIAPTYGYSSPVESSVLQMTRDSVGWSKGSIVVANLPITRPITAVMVGRSPVGVDSNYMWTGDYVGTDSTFVGSWVQPRTDGLDVSVVAMAPSGDYAVVAQNYIARTNDVTPTFVDCTPPSPEIGFPPQQCASGTWSAVSDHAELYRVDLKTGQAPRVILTLPGVEIESLALSELEDEILWQSVKRVKSRTVRYLSTTGQGPGPWYEGNEKATLSNPPMTCTGRMLEVRAFDSRVSATTPVGPSKSVFPQSLRDGCLAAQANFAGTMSPSRGATGQPTSR